jgi:serine/threonine protein phosphatase 1
MSDLYGAYKALQQCLQHSSFDYESDCFLPVGDVTDGLPEAYECIEELLKIKYLIAIKGNHDEWFREFIETGLHPQFWNCV